MTDLEQKALAAGMAVVAKSLDDAMSRLEARDDVAFARALLQIDGVWQQFQVCAKAHWDLNAAVSELRRYEGVKYDGTGKSSPAAGASQHPQ